MFSKKSLGQNFLIDKNIINKIINLVDLKNKNIIEIGPGKASLTNIILEKKPKSLTLVEKDNKLSNYLKSKYLNYKNIKILNNDILDLDFEKIIKKNSIVLGNLPYNISSQILVKVLKFKKWPPRFNDLIFMFQKEMGEKIIGKYKSSNYGRLSILSNYRLYLEKKFKVSPNCFSPKPKVESIVIHFKPIKRSSFNIKNLNNLEMVTNILFSNRRKMIKKRIFNLINSDEIKKIKNLKLDSRPSDLPPEIYYQITEILEKSSKKIFF